MSPTYAEKRAGRPLASPVRAFCAELLALCTGTTRKHAQAALRQNPDVATGHLWALAADAHAEGCRDLKSFVRRLNSGLASLRRL